MTREPQPKKEKVQEHIPGFAGYGAPHTPETDFLLRRHLAGQVETVRDRLADFIAAQKTEGKIADSLAQALRTTAFLKDELTPNPQEEVPAAPLAPLDEERLLDFDLALLEKVAGLNTPLDMLEAAGNPEKLRRALALYEEGVAEVDEVFQKRRDVLGGE